MKKTKKLKFVLPKGFNDVVYDIEDQHRSGAVDDSRAALDAVKAAMELAAGTNLDPRRRQRAARAMRDIAFHYSSVLCDEGFSAEAVDNWGDLLSVATVCADALKLTTLY